MFLLAGSSLPDGMFAGFAGAALKFKKFAESSVCRIYWINAARLCTEKQLGKANKCLHRICSLCILNNALLVSIGVVSAACWRHPEMETLIIQPGSANHFFWQDYPSKQNCDIAAFFSPHAQQKSYAPQFLQQCPFRVGHMPGLLLI